MTSSAFPSPPEGAFLKKLDGTGGKVSVSDLISYQIGWGKLLINWYEEGVKGKMPQMPGDGFITWDYKAIAKHFYKKYQLDSLQAQKKEFSQVIQHILNIVEKEANSGNLDLEGVWEWCTLASGKKWPLSKWIQVNTVAPYKRASAIIRQALK